MRRWVVVLVGPAVVTGGLVATTPVASAGNHRPAVHGAAPGLRPGMMPTRSERPINTANAHTLTYYGGPVVSDADVAIVRWGTSTFLPEVAGTASPGFDAFFSDVPASSYIAWLTEYNTTMGGGTQQHIGYGGYIGSYDITPSTSAATVDDATIQSDLLARVGDGTLPAPGQFTDPQGYNNAVYAVFFPSGKTITEQGATSGVDFCAYHSSTAATVNGVHLRYMVLPDDENSNFRGGCSSAQGQTDFQIMQSYTSHELAETITDPDVGLDTNNSLGPPLAWYENAQTGGEIGDICNAQGGTVDAFGDTFTVQKLWSNADDACIVSKPATVSPAPTGLSATPDVGGQVDLQWTNPNSDGGSAVTGNDVYRSTTPAVLGSVVHTTAPGQASYIDTPPGDGTYYYTVKVVNGVGSSDPTNQASATTDGTPPSVTETAPSTLFSLSQSVTTRYSATDGGTGVASYDVRYRVAKWNGSFGSYVMPAQWQGVTATRETLAGSPGHEYCVSERAHDMIGNVSGWTPDHCQVVPLDDRSLSRTTSHWTRTTPSSAYLQTLTSTSTSGEKLTLSGAHVSQLALVVTTCSSCGSVQIYRGSTLWRTVSTQSSSTHTKVVLVEPRFSLMTTTLVLKTTANKPVKIDGIGISRT
jgi:hypothetical protein